MKIWNPKRLLGVAMAAAALCALPAQADVIAFEGAAMAGLYLPGESFSEGGFVLTTLNDFGIVDTAIALGSQAPTGNATQFYFASNDGGLRVASTSGLGFDLTGFDVAFVPLDPPSLQTTLLMARGTLQDNSTVLAAFMFPGNGNTGYSFASYGLTSASGFTNLRQVEFFACSLVGGAMCSEPTANNGQFAIDNISVSVVPEPGAALLLALGLAGVALRTSRTRRSA
jgi:PEP-CTERM motif